jgi:hypothetical protein
LDFLVGCICLSIGCAVAWVLALYTPRGEAFLLGDTFFATAGAVLCALILWWTAPVYIVVGLLFLGPFFARGAIALTDLVRRSVSVGRHPSS